MFSVVPNLVLLPYIYLADPTIPTQKPGMSLQLGVMAPEMRQADCLKTGQVGYVITGLKSTNAVRVGDTWHHAKATNVTPLPGFRVAKAMMFAGA